MLTGLLRIVPVVFLFSVTTQEPLPEVEFEVASVKVASHTNGGMKFGPEQITFTGVTLRGLIVFAYDVKKYQVTGPPRIDSEGFDISAKMPKNSQIMHVRLMMKALLSKRLGLTVHIEARPMPMYVLVVAKGGPKMREVEGPGPQLASSADSIPRTAPGKPALGSDGFPLLGDAESLTYLLPGAGKTKLHARHESMTEFAELIAQQMTLPVIDMTDLHRRYDFDVYFSPEKRLGQTALPSVGDGTNSSQVQADGVPSIFEAVKGLGLNIEQRRMRTDIIIVDHVNQTPVDN